jgi:CDP-diacylglycerol--glycerol-3-phosphate 3-phosphatidyltransferase
MNRHPENLRGRLNLPEEKLIPGLQASRKALARFLTEPIVSLLAKTPITPNTLTVCSLVVTLAAAALVVADEFIAAGVVLLFAGSFDILDGALARRTNRVTRFGAALDSTLDRLAEAAILVSLSVVYARDGATGQVALAGVALVSSLLVSYIRARAEGLGLECQVGIFTRSERMIVLVLGLLFSYFEHVLTGTLVVIAVLSSITVIQRLYHVWKQTKT